MDTAMDRESTKSSNRLESRNLLYLNRAHNPNSGKCRLINARSVEVLSILFFEVPCQREPPLNESLPSTRASPSFTIVDQYTEAYNFDYVFKRMLLKQGISQAAHVSHPEKSNAHKNRGPSSYELGELTHERRTEDALKGPKGLPTDRVPMCHKFTCVLAVSCSQPLCLQASRQGA